LAGDLKTKTDYKRKEQHSAVRAANKRKKNK